MHTLYTGDYRQDDLLARLHPAVSSHHLPALLQGFQRTLRLLDRHSSKEKQVQPEGAPVGFADAPERDVPFDFATNIVALDILQASGKK